MRGFLPLTWILASCLAIHTAAGAGDEAARCNRLETYLLAPRFPNFLSVASDQTCITITGTCTETNLKLVEIPMWFDVTDLRQGASERALHPDPQGRFTCTIPRSEAKDRDLLLSGWALAREREGKLEVRSGMKYVTAQVPGAQLPPAKPKSRKGIGGCPFDHPDMKELGISSVTLNILPSEFMSHQGGPGCTPWEYAGRTWYVRDDAVARYDRDMILAARNAWMVSAILLIPPARESSEGSWLKTVTWPDADPGAAFVLPNLDSREGCLAWAAALSFLTHRYSRPDGLHGRVHHWILHNEVNSGFYWANAGNLPELRYLDVYQKSMRIANLLARDCDPNAKALISLDHCWTAKPDPRCFPARDLLGLLTVFCRREGDFPWGIAFHPYAEDIHNPRTWEDPNSVFSNDTPFITMKNIEVLAAWVRQPHALYYGGFPGQAREIQLTEQGFNSPDYQESTLRDQAAAMAYAWKKIEPLPVITAFQYHLWADDHSEGGLKLGLRKFADDPSDPHGRKPIWYLYQKLGGPGWQSAVDSAKPVLGIDHWVDILHQEEIPGLAKGRR